MNAEPIKLLCIAPLPKMIDVPRQFELVEAVGSNAVEDALARHGGELRGLVTSGGNKTLIDEAFLSRFPALEIVAVNGVGYDKVDVSAARLCHVTVTNTPDVLTDEVADLTVGLLIATVRRIPAAERFLRDGKWLAQPFPLSASLRGRRIGIVGLGRIGRAVATRLKAFGLDVAYCGRTKQDDVDYPYFRSVPDLADAVDTLIVMTSGGPATEGLIDADILARLGSQGILINTSRGSVVREGDLVAALEQGNLLGCGLDVYKDEPQVSEALIRRDNVVLLPHVGSATTFTRAAMGQLVIDNLVSWFSGKGAITPVN